MKGQFLRWTRALKGHRKWVMGAEGTLSSGIERRSPSVTEEKSFDSAEGYSLLRDVEGGLLSGAKTWGSLVIGGYSDHFCCKPNTMGLMSHVVLMRQSMMVGMAVPFPPNENPPPGIQTVGLFVKSPASCSAFCSWECCIAGGASTIVLDLWEGTDR